MLRKQPNLTFVSPWNQDDDTSRRGKTKQWPLTIFIILAKLDLHARVAKNAFSQIGVLDYSGKWKKYGKYSHDTSRRGKTKQWSLTIFIILAKLDLHELQKMRFHKFEYSTTRANGKNTASTRTREICLRVAIR